MKVFVSGCYDMLHSGHVSFYPNEAKQGGMTEERGDGRNETGKQRNGETRGRRDDGKMTEGLK